MENQVKFRALTLRLSEDELAALGRMAQQKRLSKDALVRHCIRVFVAIEKRLIAGDKLFFEDKDKQKSELFII